MDGVMLGVTGVALAMAVAMSIIAVRLLRGEKQRSAARIEALESAAREDVDLTDVDYQDADIRYQDYQPDAELEPAIGPMFRATDEPKAPSRRWLALGGVAVVMAALAGTMYVVFKPAAVGAEASAAGAPAASRPASAAAASVSSGAQLRPIELLSLKHTIEGNTFSLAGLVVNPIDATPLTHVIAVVYLFDKDGAYFATGKAELEFSGLRPGEESPFTIKIPNVEHVGKYRVGFRRDDGSVIAHLDKRGQKGGSMTEGGGDR
jgi:hypothetical protein